MISCNSGGGNKTGITANQNCAVGDVSTMMCQPFIGCGSPFVEQSWSSGNTRLAKYKRRVVQWSWYFVINGYVARIRTEVYISGRRMSVKGVSSIVQNIPVSSGSPALKTCLPSKSSHKVGV